MTGIIILLIEYFKTWYNKLANLFLYDKDMIGRGCIPFCLIKYGYRRIPIYCNNCIERDRIFVVGYFEKSF